jgi:hypothetical protein
MGSSCSDDISKFLRCLAAMLRFLKPGAELLMGVRSKALGLGMSG